MKKNYTEPELQKVDFEVEDIIAASGPDFDEECGKKGVYCRITPSF